MNHTLKNYEKIKDRYNSFKVISRHLESKGILPKRGRKFTKVMISSIAHGRLKHEEVEEAIKEIAESIV